MDKTRREAREERRRAEARRNQSKWLVYIVIAAVVVTVLLVLANQVQKPADRNYTQKNGNQLGDPNAPATLVEYADFQCIHCYNFYTGTEELVVQNHVDTGQILYELRFVNFLGPESTAAAEAVYCAADQNQFWEYHDAVFANYSSGNSGGYTEANLIDFAQAIGLDIDQFTSCMDSDEKLDVIQQNLVDAQASGVNGTPGFVLNGELLEGGNLPYVQLQEAILAAIGE